MWENFFERVNDALMVRCWQRVEFEKLWHMAKYFECWQNKFHHVVPFTFFFASSYITYFYMFKTISSNVILLYIFKNFLELYNLEAQSVSYKIFLTMISHQYSPKLERSIFRGSDETHIQSSAINWLLNIPKMPPIMQLVSTSYQ